LAVDKKFRLFYLLTVTQLTLFFIYLLNLLNKSIPVFASDVDPSYEYLDNALKILYGITPGHSDHPGATMQFLLAIFFIFFKNSFKRSGNLDYRSSFVENPESYAVAYVVFLLVILTFVILFIVKRFKQKNAGFLFTTYPLVLLLVLSGQVGQLVRVSPESLLILISTILLLQILSTKEFLEYKKIKYRNLLLTSLILAAGVATKITFLPMFALLIFIRGFRQKIFLLTSSLIFLFILVLPQRGTFRVTWFSNIFFNSGRWGQQGESGKSLSQILGGLTDLWTAQYPFMGVALLVSAVLFIRSKWNFKVSEKYLAYTLIALILAGSTLIVKESYPRDFAHLAPFSALLFLLIARKLLEDFKPYFYPNTKKVPIFILSAIFVGLFFQFAIKTEITFINIRHVILNDANAKNTEIFPGYEYDNFTRNLMSNENFVISQYLTPSEYAGLQFGNLYYGQGMIGENIDKKFPYGLELNIWNATVYNGLSEPIGCQYLKSALDGKTQIYLQSNEIEDTLYRVNNSVHSYLWEVYEDPVVIGSTKLYKIKSAGCK